MRRRPSAVLLALGLALAPEAGGRQQKEPPKDQPRALVALPLGVAAGAPTRVAVRGLKLDAASAVKADAGVEVKILSKGRANVPNQQDAARVGDTQVEVEVAVPKDFAGGFLSLVLVTPAGETAPLRVFVDREPALAEKEPNNGFAQAQPLPLGQVVQGRIDGAQDVDVYRIEGKAGQKVAFEVVAARFGSALDATLTLYDAAGRELAFNDDFDGLPDARLDVTLPTDGAYFLSLADAHEQGGPAHVYRLQARAR